LFVNIGGATIEFSGIDLKTNFQWVSLGSLTPPLGVDDAAYRIKNVLPGNNSFGYTPRLDMKELAPPVGLRIRALSSDRLGVTIRDDLTVAEVSAFSMTAIGFKTINQQG